MAVEPDRSQLRLPAPGSNAQAISKTGEAARSHVPMASASGIAPRRARSLRSRAGSEANGARAHARPRAHAFCSMRTGLARAAAGPTEALLLGPGGAKPVPVKPVPVKPVRWACEPGAVVLEAAACRRTA